MLPEYRTNMWKVVVCVVPLLVRTVDHVRRTCFSVCFVWAAEKLAHLRPPKAAPASAVLCGGEKQGKEREERLCHAQLNGCIESRSHERTVSCCKSHWCSWTWLPKRWRSFNKSLCMHTGECVWVCNICMLCLYQSQSITWVTNLGYWK